MKVLFCVLALVLPAAAQKTVTPESCAKAGMAYLYRGDSGSSACVPHQPSSAPTPTEIKLPNGNIISTLANGEKWVKIQFNGEPLGIQLFPYMPAMGEFKTLIVHNLPPSDIIGAPQSIATIVWGDCAAKTYQFMGSVFYEGKMRGGLPDGDGPTPPENVMRRVRPGSGMEHVFNIVCKH